MTKLLPLLTATMRKWDKIIHRGLSSVRIIRKRRASEESKMWNVIGSGSHMLGGWPPFSGSSVPCPKCGHLVRVRGKCSQHNHNKPWLRWFLYFWHTNCNIKLVPSSIRHTSIGNNGKLGTKGWEAEHSWPLQLLAIVNCPAVHRSSCPNCFGQLSFCHCWTYGGSHEASSTQTLDGITSDIFIPFSLLFPSFLFLYCCHRCMLSHF